MPRRNDESTILHETANLYLNSDLEICLNQSTHAVVVGKAKSVDSAKATMDALELHIGRLRRAVQGGARLA